MFVHNFEKWMSHLQCYNVSRKLFLVSKSHVFIMEIFDECIEWDKKSQPFPKYRAYPNN